MQKLCLSTKPQHRKLDEPFYAVLTGYSYSKLRPSPMGDVIVSSLLLVVDFFSFSLAMKGNIKYNHI